MLKMQRTVAILATMDTKGAEADFLRAEIEALGGKALIIDLGVIGTSRFSADISTLEILQLSGADAEQMLQNPTREKVVPALVEGARRKLLALIRNGDIHSVLGLGGTQGTSICSQIMRALPYGFGKNLISTAASGDTEPFVGITDINMMFSVSDILGLNPFTRKILANAAGAAYGMALKSDLDIQPDEGCKGTIGMTNLGVLTVGAMHAVQLIHDAGYEVITFHAIGSGGRAMEQMMREGILVGVFDYGLGEIADEVFGGLRACRDSERLTTAGQLGLPQVICPGGAEHIGVLLQTPNEVPDAYKDHDYIFHSPVVFAPRLKAEELKQVATEITGRLKHSKKNTIFMIPLKGVGSYSTPGGPMVNPELDAVFFEALRSSMPEGIELRELDYGAEDPEFVEQSVKALIKMIESEC